MAGPQVTSFFTARENMTRTMSNIEQHTRRLDKAFGSFGARMRAGIGLNVVNHGMDLLYRAMYKVGQIIPDLIGKGEAWAATINDITDATGMSAQQASILAGVQFEMTGSTDGLATSLGALAKSVTTNQKAWRDFGVQIGHNKDGTVDAYRTFQNLRQAVAASGAGTLSFAAATKLAGRGARDLLDILQLSNPQFRAYAQLARQAGLILTDAGNQAAEQWSRTQNLLSAAITGIGAQILQGVAPVLIGLTNGITSAITANMSNIVNFVSGAIAFVAGMVGSFLGVDITTNLVGQIDKLGSRHGGGGGGGGLHQPPQTGLKNTAKATRDLTAANKALADALRDLARARAESTFGGNMSRVEYLLALQARQADIKQAKERVAQARKQLSDHKGTLGKMVDANAAATKKIGNAFTALHGDNGPIVKGLKKTLADSRKFGQQFAAMIKDFLFGPEQITGGNTSSIFGGMGPNAKTERRGGIFDTMAGILKGVQGFLQWGQTQFQNLLTGIQNVTNAVTTGLANVVTSIGDLLAGIKGIFPDLFPNRPPGIGPGGQIPLYPTRAGAGTGPRLGRTGTGFRPQRSLNPPESEGPQPGPAPGLSLVTANSPAMTALSRAFDSTRMSDSITSGTSPVGEMLGFIDQDVLGLQSTFTDGINLAPGTVMDVKGAGGFFPVTNWSGTALSIWPSGGRSLPVDLGNQSLDLPNSVKDDIFQTRVWTETTARRVQYGDYSAGSLLWNIWQELKSMPHVATAGKPSRSGTSSLRAAAR